ncbi:MAG: (Fe-S)-binding protein [Candidatus Cloacimonetes bacterium]|nr:(Fe-S)-binding protein [Candidatus Cloacimonadota bacterium]
MDKFSKKGIELNSESGIQEAIRRFFQDAEKIFDAVMLPMRVPAKDSYAWIMIKDREYLKDATPIAPIMPVNGAKALKRFTRKGEARLKVAALMRPCEIRAAVELTKLNQINLDDVILCSYDCPGALPMQDYISEPEAGEAKFQYLLDNDIWNSAEVKPVCRICDKFSLPASDLHFAIEQGKVIIIANSEKGAEILKDMNLPGAYLLENWDRSIQQIKQKRLAAKEQNFAETKNKIEGFEKLLETFSVCIGCHNCQSACPICYCRQCYFDSVTAKPNADVVMMKMEQRGGLTLPMDRIMFHTGRMAHMSLSCVSCGLCSDACPVDIPVAEIFSYVGSQTQQAFEYCAGESLGDALPMKEYKSDELSELKAILSDATAQEVADE